MHNSRFSSDQPDLPIPFTVCSQSVEKFEKLVVDLITPRPMEQALVRVRHLGSAHCQIFYGIDLPWKNLLQNALLWNEIL